MSFLKRFQYNSPVILTYTIIAICVLLIGQVTEGLSTKYIFSVYRGEFTDPLFYVRFVGYIFGHVNFAHFFNNFMLILLLGPMLEEKYGSRNIIILIATTCIVTGIVHVIFFDTMLMGASGIVFMFILLCSFVNLEKGRIPITFILVVIIFIGREIYDSFAIADDISQVAHIIGGLCGAVLGFFLNKHKLIRSKVAKEKVIPKEVTTEEATTE